MANIIDTSYFIGEISIPNIAQAEIAANVNESIVKYEREVLISLLGYELYKELAAHTIVADDKFDKLINGDEFTFEVNGATVTTKWEGLKGFAKKSLISYYVYWHYRRKNASYMAANNLEVEAKTENSTKVSLYTKMVDIWNEFIEMYGDTCSYYANDYYVGVSLSNYYPVGYAPSAYNYLVAKKADFPTWIYSSQGSKINVFGV